MNLEAVLQFVRMSDQQALAVIFKEIALTRKGRDEQAARQFSVGNMVVFQLSDKSFKGRILAIKRRGRIVLECSDGDHQHAHVRVPASMLMRCA
jgi:hypothetical protein